MIDFCTELFIIFEYKTFLGPDFETMSDFTFLGPDFEMMSDFTRKIITAKGAPSVFKISKHMCLVNRVV